MLGLAWLLSGVVEVPSDDPVLPFTAAAPMEFAHVVFGYVSVSGGGLGFVGGGNDGSGYAGVARVASSTSVQLRLPLPPWPACTNQSRPHGVSCLSVAFLTSFCIEIEPSEHVVWLWKSPAAYVPPRSAFTWLVPSAAALTAAMASAMRRLGKANRFMTLLAFGFDECGRVRRWAPNPRIDA